jgi:ectoine hydroxylase-related dioxygenase (phytanoyl-CoA dioxygenase family)
MSQIRANRAFSIAICASSIAMRTGCSSSTGPGIIDAAEDALGADCHVIGQTAWRSHPGFVGEGFHADYLPPPASAAPQGDCVPAIFILTVHFYLCDVSRELAPTRIIAGTHRARRAPLPGESKWNGRTSEPVLANAGDALLFRSDVWHAGSDNVTSAEVRYLLQVHYGRREMAQHFSPFAHWRFAPHVLAIASKRQRRLLGDHDPGAYD